MSKKMSIIVGIVLFILIIGSSYMKLGASSSKTNNKTNNTSSDENVVEQGTDIVYKGKFPIPVENFIKVSSGFGKREAHGVVSGNHTGIDLCGSIGSKVISVADGEVTYSGWQSGYGNCVEIKHNGEDGSVFYTFYAHMRDNSLQVTKGQKVLLGQVIGTQGSTGNSTGDHLHFEVRTSGGSNKYAVNPAPYLFNEK